MLEADLDSVHENVQDAVFYLKNTYYFLKTILYTIFKTHNFNKI